MKAAICRRYGPPEIVAIQDIDTPTPSTGEILVAIEAAGLTSGDARIRAARVPQGMGPIIRLVFGINGPRQKILGREYSGYVAAIGKGVQGFQIGDPVFGITGGMTMGAHAEYVVVSANSHILKRPSKLTATKAAAFFFGGLTAADFLIDQCCLKSSEKILIIGATGAVGSAAIQIAKHLGTDITACVSKPNLSLAKELGAHCVIDYTSNPQFDQYDVILDIPGVLQDPLQYLAPGGRVGIVTATLKQMLGSLHRPIRSENRKICVGVVKETPAALQRLITLFDAGAYDPLIGAVLPFKDISQAYSIADMGHKRGNLVLILTHQHTEQGIHGRQL